MNKMSKMLLTVFIVVLSMPEVQAADSMYVDSSGNVGVGTNTPSSVLHVTRSDGTAKVLVEETNASVAGRTLFELKNAGNTKFTINNTNAGVQWAFTNSGTEFRISRQGSGVVELSLDNSGNLYTSGSVNPPSSREMKQDITAVDPEAVLDKVMELPISEWSYKRDRAHRHMGPMAEDFAKTFGLGINDKSISTTDGSGVALAAIQGLSNKLDEKSATIKSLQKELRALKKLVQTLAAKDKVVAITTQ